jgi:hypothetical protein
MLVGAIGPGLVKEVHLGADLPDLGEGWTVQGAGSSSCHIVELRLDCAFGDLAPGELRLLQATSAVGFAPQWEVKTTAQLAAGNDGTPGNDAATTVVGILLT